MKLVVVRHGQTDWNKDHKVMGRTDVPLNDTGRKEALEAARNLVGKKFDAIYSSSLKRALETAEIIGDQIGKAFVEISDLITERDFGNLAGKSWDEIETIIPKAREIDREQKYDYSPYGGENPDQVRNRVEKFVNEIKNKGYQDVLVVCHGGIIRILESMNGETRLDIPSGSITEFEV